VGQIRKGSNDAGGWPAVCVEARPWVTAADATFRGRRPPIEDRLLAEIAVSMPASIADRHLVLAPTTSAVVEAAGAAVARLEHATPAPLGALTGFLLRSEAVATSKIERVDVELDELARASVGQRAGAAARLVLGAMDAIQGLIRRSADGLSVDSILAAHHDLLAGDPVDARYAGRLRTQQNWIGGSDFTPRGAAYVPPPPELVPDLVDDLVHFAGRIDLPGVAVAAIVHAQFELIHPFVDGNGRIGRALLNAVFRSRRLTVEAAVPVASVLLTDIVGYFAVLRAYADGDVDALVAHLAAATLTACEEAKVSATTLAAMPERWRDEAGQPRRDSAARSLIDVLLAEPVVTAARARTLTGASPPAVHQALNRLTEAGVLVEVTGGARDRVWVADGVLDEIDRFHERLSAGARPNPGWATAAS